MDVTRPGNATVAERFRVRILSVDLCDFFVSQYFEFDQWRMRCMMQHDFMICVIGFEI